MTARKDDLPPPPKPIAGTSIRLPDELKVRVDRVGKARGYRNRSEVILRLLEYALDRIEGKS
jgi:metal-responsive CopG/Arc/MetJ family transcriptional regulator